MGKKKVELRVVDRLVSYNKLHWSILGEKRNVAKKFLEAFSNLQVDTRLYGSVARGDVSKTSDIDIIIYDLIPSYMIENIILNLGYSILGKNIVMATPNHAIKGHIELENDITVSFPLITFQVREIEFYRFGGNISLQDIQTGKREVGVDKRLLLIEPLDDGHRERSVLHVSIKDLLALGFPQRLLEERIRVLKRRDHVGRTGVFLNQEIHTEETFELVLKQLKDRNPLIRKKITDISKS